MTLTKKYKRFTPKKLVCVEEAPSLTMPLVPSEKMIVAGAKRLVRWETGKEKWPDSWSTLDVASSRVDADRCWRSMWLEASKVVRKNK